MPTSEAPTNVNEDLNAPNGSAGAEPAGGQAAGSDGGQQGAPAGIVPRPISTSRWVDYDTHELLDMINELEDERRWARLREGILWAVLFHIFLLSAVTWIPTYVLRAPKVIDPFDAIQQRKDLTYLDLPPDALRNLQKAKPKVAEKPPTIDRKTIEELNRESPPSPAPAPPPQQQATTKAPVTPPPTQAAPPNPQSPVDAPRPSPVPARPNFAMSQNPVDQLQDAMRNAMRNRGSGELQAPSGGLSMHPGAGTGGVQILSNTQGVDFSSWLAAWHYETERTWDPLIPDEVNPPILKSGMVAIQFKVLPNGRLMPDSVQLVGRSGDVALDRAAWGALTGSGYPPLPRDFHGPYIELRAYFLYNMQPQQ